MLTPQSPIPTQFVSGVQADIASANPSLSSINASASPLMPITNRPEAIMSRGSGSYLWDERGTQYLDFIQGWAVNSLGHCAPEVSEVLAKQSQTLLTPSPALHNRPQLELAQQLIALSGLHQAHFTNSGAEANEVAIKLARKWGQLHRQGAYRIITTDNAFHGRTLATMAASGKPEWQKMYQPNIDGFLKVPFDDLGAVTAAIDPSVVAIMVEPIQGEGGVVVPETGYLHGLQEVAQQHNLLLILDEIQTGIGRTGSLFAFQQAAVKPDVITLGKGLGAGVPLAAVVASERASCFVNGDQGGTYNGNPLMTAVGLSVLNTVSQAEFLHHIQVMGTTLNQGLTKRVEHHRFKEVRGRGLLWALQLAEPKAAEITARAFANGLLINPAKPDVLRFMPSLRVNSIELEEFFQRLDASL